MLLPIGEAEELLVDEDLPEDGIIFIGHEDHDLDENHVPVCEDAADASTEITEDHESASEGTRDALLPNLNQDDKAEKEESVEDTEDTGTFQELDQGPEIKTKDVSEVETQRSGEDTTTDNRFG